MPATTVTLRPTAIGSYDTFTLTSGATKVIAASDALDSTYLTPVGPGDLQSFNVTDIPSPGGSIVSSVTVYSRINQNGAGFCQWTPRLIANAIDLDGTLVAHAVSGMLETSQVFLTKPGGGAWTVSDVNTLQIGGQFNWSSAPPDLMDTWAVVVYNPVPANLERVRVVGTQRLLLKREPRRTIKMTGPIKMADAELLDLVPWSHRNGPHAQGLGWGDLSWQRRPSRLLQSTLDLNTMTVTATAEDWRPHFVMLYDEGNTLISPGSMANGVARFYVGDRTYERDSRAWVEDPSDGTVREISYDVEALNGGEFSGMLMEGASSNQLLRSSFVSGGTGLTFAGTGVNGSAANVDTDDLLFESSVTPQSLELTAGTPHASELSCSWPATVSILANTVCRLSIDHKDDSSEALVWRMFRGVDSRFWNDTTETWDVGSVTNTITMSATKARYMSNAFDVGASNTTLTFGLAQAVGGTSGRINHVYHVQLETQPFVSSRIVTDTTVTTRAAGMLSYTNVSGARNWPATRGTFTCEVIPEWDSADLLGTAYVPTIFDLTYDGSNYFTLSWNASTGNLEAKLNSAAVIATATKAFVPVRGTAYSIAMRWTSSEQELGLAARTLSVFVDGVKGSDVTYSSTPITESNANWTSGDPFEGSIKFMRVTQVVMTDEEIARLAQ